MKKLINQNDKLNEELINTIEANFVFDKKPINRFSEVKKESDINQRNKQDLLENLKKQLNSIENCKLRNYSKNIVLGEGNIDSPIMLIGEAPGEIEDKVGNPFKGESGELLDKMLIAINIKRENIYTSYAINFRPPEDRKPTSQEIKRYSNFLKEHISIIDPKIIILMGSTAMEAVTGINEKISSERGKWKEIILNNNTYPLMITFNPSYLIRYPDNKKYSWEDLKKIREKVKELKLTI
ncbi:uracil-DNA glycosylase [Candidatus Pelagibacter sp. HIMB1521]|uniref:uracil-DNA glycosylase n=1 Tax=Candidatus Pelagibacter sp. HIMB1521 TaxID=3413344 RepID=UPI003F859DBF